MPSLEELIKEVPPEKLNRSCREKHLREVARLTTKWREIAPFMGLKDSEEKAIESEYPKSILRQRIALFTRWHAKSPHSATYMKLIQILYKLDRIDLVEKLVEVLTQDDVDDEDTYTAYLRNLYRTRTSRTLQWPPVPHCEYIKLTLVKEDEVQRMHIVHLSERAKKKETVELENILMLDQENRKVILVDGVPGAGKSTFTLNACQRWANRTLFEGYDYVILIDLRNPALDSAKTLSDILPCRTIDGCKKDYKMAQEAAKNMIALCGETTLFVFDGWDAFPDDHQKNSLIQKILFEPEHLTLHMSTILITSRPDSSANLSHIASSRIQISGFTQTEVNKYFTAVLGGNSSRVDKLFGHLYKHPSLLSTCSIPLNAAIIVHFFLCLKESLPSMCTLHDAFCALVLNCIIHASIPERELTFPSSLLSRGPRYALSKLPPDLKRQLDKFASLAHKGSAENRETFTEEDLEQVGLVEPFSTLGLLQSVESFTWLGKSKFYNFMHSSLQQFLTALHISQFPCTVQAGLFEKAFSLDNFSLLHSLFAPRDLQVYILTIFQFFAGFTELKGQELQKTIIQVVDTYKKVRHQFLIFLKHNLSTMRKRPFLSLVRCLHDAQNEPLCEEVASHLEEEIDLAYVGLKPYDCVAVGYLLQFFKCKETTERKNTESKCKETTAVSVNLSETSIDSRCIDYPCKEFSDSQKQRCSLKLFLHGNSICAEGVSSIAQLLHTQQLVHLDLSYNTISDKGAEHIANALGSNTSLLHLDLSINTISDEGAEHIANALGSNTSLRLLNLESCGITDEGMTKLSGALSRNHTLQELCLSKNPFTDDGLLELGESLQKNQGLRTLKINSDVDLRMKELLKYNSTLSKVTSQGLEIFVFCLTENKQITRLDVGEFGEQDAAVKKSLKLVNEQRIKKDIQVLTLFCSTRTLARFP